MKMKMVIINCIFTLFFVNVLNTRVMTITNYHMDVMCKKIKVVGFGDDGAVVTTGELLEGCRTHCNSCNMC